MDGSFSKVATREMYASIDRLFGKLERQLLKSKAKLVERKSAVVFQNSVTRRLQAVQRADDGRIELIDACSPTSEE